MSAPPISGSDPVAPDPPPSPPPGHAAPARSAPRRGWLSLFRTRPADASSPATGAPSPLAGEGSGGGARAPEPDPTDLARARAAGWRRADLVWERCQEAAAAAWSDNRSDEAVALWRRAARIAVWRMMPGDPRRATSLANLAFADRLRGRDARAARRYARARALWARVPARIAGVEPARRARSSLFHLRMEARHWDTYRDNLRTRMARFAEESAEALAALAAGRPSPHRLAGRWRAEKPPVFDDTRKLLAAALLIAGPEAMPSADTRQDPARR